MTTFDTVAPAGFAFVLSSRREEPIMTNAPESPFLTTSEAADFLRLDSRTLDNMRWRNNGPRYRKHGGKVFYHINDLNYWSTMRDCDSGPRIELDNG